MASENERKLIVNCLPLTQAERTAFVRAAKGVRQEFVGDELESQALSWHASVPEELRGQVTAVIGNISEQECIQCKHLDWLQTWSAGVDRYQKPGVLGRGVMLTSASGAYGQSVSEHVFAMMLAMMKNIPQYARQGMQGQWQDAGPALTPLGAKALIVGAGDIGSHIAALCKAIGMTTFGIRRHADLPMQGFDSMAGYDQLDEALPDADVVVLVLPSTKQTHHIINAKRLSLMKSSALVINAGRGGAIDTQALVEALEQGTIRGAGLDVTDPEPLPHDHPLWKQERCLITPHVAGGNHLSSTWNRIVDIALHNVRNYVSGHSLLNLVQ